MVIDVTFDKLLENIVEQVKESQLKLGYARETIRLYYLAESFFGLLGCDRIPSDLDGALDFLRNASEFSSSALGKLNLRSTRDGRVEVSVPSEGVACIHEQVPASEFLASLVSLFSERRATLEQVQSLFERYGDYSCSKVPEDSGFDYVLRFEGGMPDTFLYCVKEEPHGLVYHRFTDQDYHARFREPAVFIRDPMRPCAQSSLEAAWSCGRGR